PAGLAWCCTRESRRSACSDLAQARKPARLQPRHPVTEEAFGDSSEPHNDWCVAKGCYRIALLSHRHDGLPTRRRAGVDGNGMTRSQKLVFAAAAAAAPVAAPARPGAQPASPLAGVWTLNRSQSEMSGEIGFNVTLPPTSEPGADQTVG